MSSSASNPIKDELLLGYVEQTLDAAQTARVRESVSSEMLAQLDAMRSDREALAMSCASDESLDFAPEVLARVERSMLLEDDPIAPLIDFRRPARPHWHRYAAAAVFVILLGGATFMVGRSLWLGSSDGLFVGGPSDSGAADPGSTVVDATEPESVPETQIAVAPTDSVSEGTGGGEAEAVEESAVASSTTDRVGASALAIDVGLVGVLTSSEMERSVESLRSLLEAEGGGIVTNVSLASLSGAGGGVSPGDPRQDSQATRNPVGVPGGFDRDRAPGNPRPGGVGDALVDERFVSLEDQMDYASRGYELTLVGRPSTLLQALRSLNQSGRGDRVRLLQPGGGRVLVDRVAPNVPENVRWERVMTWWMRPGDHFEEALAVVEQTADEPVVTLPVRIITTNR